MNSDTGSRHGLRGTLLVATTNPGKLREIVPLLDGLPIRLLTLADVPAVTTPEETGASFAENAREKAMYYARTTGLPAVAEDSGFEVDALDGEPGIVSARFLAPDASYEERFAELYRRLSDRGLGQSGARFVCALAFVAGSEVRFETIGSVKGLLAAQPAGAEGFGYDPVFFFPPYERTFGQVSPAEKAAVSHRAQAFRALKSYFELHPL